MFALDVENAMPCEYKIEAQFCRLLRNWFNAEDEPGIPANIRCQYRLHMRQWLLEGYPLGQFPPVTRYVRGIPIVSYEALVLQCERKLQMYDHVPGNTYNARATGSQEVEQFFSTFRDLDPTGKGTPKPDVIPDMMATVVEINNFRLNPDKPFHIKTSKAEVYPNTAYIKGDLPQEERECVSDSNLICPRNHQFDYEERGRGMHRRKKGLITRPDEPAQSERGVRQYHARNDSKILAHLRVGLLDLPN
uniref:Uncharacterized protein LOC111102067 n=1 Tax=Crassostrea virginica TaxID=6565 RepID=A0A8B8AIQ1_CRAVI|nr:uncharacterized protein LOC111102067 [Crassostrea virginica]